MAQLEDELTVAHEDTQAAFKSVKPPVNISTGSPITAGGAVTVPDPAGSGALATVLAMLVAVLAAFGVGWLYLRRKPS